MELRLVTGKCIKRKRVSTQGREREGGGMGARKSAVRRLDCMPSRPRGCGWSAFAAPNAPMHTTRRKREREEREMEREERGSEHDPRARARQPVTPTTPNETVKPAMPSGSRPAPRPEKEAPTCTAPSERPAPCTASSARSAPPQLVRG
ncbi:unnamed protein product [Prorocentrum cordatum]|uniref:Uncharacterized protein n=1 Tax=Prorocentrum cordatum TaxID=2364126 RepID=A0ABN9UQM0_9DINO|nr:unnamed protein product [Polarella glacialis]